MTTDGDRSYAEKYARWEAEHRDWWNQLTQRQRALVMLAKSKPESRRHTVLLTILSELPED